MARVIKKTIQTTITQDGGNVVEETFTKVEISDEPEVAVVEKNTFFLDNDEEEEEWFKKAGENDEDDSVDIYILDDDKSW